MKNLLFIIFTLCSSGNDNAAELRTPTYAQLKEEIFSVKCLVCHSPGGPAQDYPMLNLNDLFAGEYPMVVPYDPEASLLLIKSRPGPRRSMPPPYSNLSPLTADEVQLITSWIQAGANT